MDILDIYIVFNVLNELSIKNIIRFSRVDKKCNKIYHEYMKVRTSSLIKTIIEGDNNKEEVTVLPNGVKEGKSTLYINESEDNIKVIRYRIVQEYLDGVKHGLGRKYYSSLDLLLHECTYINGILDGESISYNYDSSIALKGKYVNGIREGIWYEYYSTGIISYIISFLHGLRDGIYLSYRPNGTLRIRAEYKLDKLHGEYKEYGESFRYDMGDKVISDNTGRGYSPPIMLRNLKLIHMDP